MLKIKSEMLKIRKNFKIIKLEKISRISEKFFEKLKGGQILQLLVRVRNPNFIEKGFGVIYIQLLRISGGRVV